MWTALTTRHAHLAEHDGDVLRYPAAVAPFCAVAEPGIPVQIEPLLRNGMLYFVGALPELIGSSYTVEHGLVTQMIHRDRDVKAPDPLPEEVELTLENAAEMVELTELAFPGYFRPETPKLGHYRGIRQDGHLVAMAGERLRLPGLYEVSGVCTRPGYTGRGYAKHLIRRLLHRTDEEIPFLHVGSANEPAIRLYESLEFEICGEVELIKISKPD